jgi:hypothetical protein
MRFADRRLPRLAQHRLFPAALLATAGCAPFSSTDAPLDSSGRSVGSAPPVVAAAGTAATPAPVRCAAGHFCDGFDRADVVDPQWLAQGPGVRTALSIDHTIGDRTPNGALRISTQSGNSQDWIQIAHVFDSLTSVVASVSVRRGEVAASGELQVLRFASNDDSEVFIYVNGGQVALAEYLDPRSFYVSSVTLSLPADTWQRFDLEIDLGSRAARLSGGGSEIDLSLKGPHLAPVILSLGVISPSAPSATDVWLDDLDLVPR